MYANIPGAMSPKKEAEGDDNFPYPTRRAAYCKVNNVPAEALAFTPKRAKIDAS